MAVGLLLAPIAAQADSSNIDFEGYSLGNINGQHGWSKTGAYDVAVANVADFSNASGFGFEDQALRISNAVTSGAFGDQAFAPSLVHASGEGARTHFDASFDIGSTKSTPQTGLSNSVSPDAGDGARMSYLRFEDQADGIHVFFDDTTDTGPVGTTADFNETDIATLSRTAAHHVRFSISFAPGAHNDLVKIYIDGDLKITGTTWEDYYRFDPEQTPGGNVVPDISTMLFRAGGTAVPANSGFGYLIDGLTYSSTNTVQCTTTCYVDGVNGQDANGGTSPSDAKKTIQAGVDTVQSGGTVVVAAGTYDEAVTVDKDNVTLQGAQAGVDARGRSATETILESSTGGLGGSPISIAANGVTVDGFKFKGIGNPGDSRFGINLTTGADRSDLTIENSIFLNLYEGIHRPDFSVDGLTVDKNVFTNDPGNQLLQDAGLWLAGGGDETDNVTITHNDFSKMENDPNGDFAAINLNGGTTATITGNTSDHDGSFIVMVDFSGVTIGSNTTDNEAGSTIFLGLGNSGITVQNNVLQNGFRGVRLSTAFGTGLSSDIQVLNNKIVDMENAGVFVDTGTVSDVVKVIGNSITNSAPAAGYHAVRNASAHDVDASANWWGSTVASTVSALTNGSVDFTPFLHSGTDTDNATKGFQGDYSTLHVTALGIQSGSTSRIEEGVNRVDALGTVLVGPGTFTGDNAVAKTVTLKGAQFGIAFGGRTFGDSSESTINGTTTLQASTVTFDGFSVTRPTVTIDDSANGVVVKTAGSGATISNNIFKNITNTHTPTSDFQAAAQAIYLENGPDSVSITDNKISDISSPRSAKGVLIGDSTASNSSTGIVITGNTITNVTSTVRGAYGIQTNNAVGAELDIENNTISNLTASAAGGWIHAIGLENDTPNTTVSHNVISGFTSPSTNQVAVWLEGPNGVYQTVAIHRNSLAVGASASGIVVDPATPANGTVSGTCNWWGNANGPSSVLGSTATGSGSGVSPKVDFTPWLVSSTLNGSCTPITLGTAAHPNPANGDEGDSFTVNGSFTSASLVAPTIGADNGFGSFVDHHDGSWTWSFTAPDQYGPTTIHVTATDKNGTTASDSFSTKANNVAPTGTFNAPGSVLFNTGFTISITSPIDPGAAEGLTYKFDCGSGYGSFGAAHTANCTAPATPGDIAVKGTIKDKDGDSNEYTATVHVTQQEISLTPASRNFGSVLVNHHSGNTVFTVKNVGNAPLTIGTVSMGGTNPSMFPINQNNCFGMTLTAGQQCTILVWFAPNSQGAKSAQLAVQSNDPDHASVMSNLTGNGAIASHGTITIVLNTHPNAHSFTFNGTNGIGTFQLTGAPGSTQAVFTKPVGTYQITQTNSAGWGLSGLTCDSGQTADPAHHRVLINLAANANVTCTFTDSRRQADAQIAQALAGPYHGNNVYETSPSASQQVHSVIAAGVTRSVYVLLQNDSVDTDSFKVLASWTGSPKYTVTITRNNVDITSAVEAGTYSVNTLASGASVTLKVTITAQAGTPATASGNLDVKLTSKSAPTVSDIVRAHVTAQ